ncbi:MAG TPA: hypothetical protein VEZ16_17230 [Microvirga sp.]|nr:hypothetical protein [Microvirga sp.]
MYLDLLAALEDSWLGHTARHSAWLFTVANLLHVLGAAFLVGGIAVFDLKVLAERGRQAWQVGRFAIPLAATGLAVQIPTGLILLAVEARALGTNPAFYAKTALIALGLANVALFHARFGRILRKDALPPDARAYAVVSLIAWILALLAGRMIAYL